MTILDSASLLRGQLVRLTAANSATDPEIAVHWGCNSEYLRLLDTEPARPFTLKERRTRDEEGDVAELNYFFRIRPLNDDRPLGFVGLWQIFWANGEGFLGIGIGNPADWGQGYGTDAMRVMLRFAFTELNLHRISLQVFEYNTRAIRSYEKAGFKREGVERQYLLRNGRRWDIVYMGALRSEWQRQTTP